VTGKTEFRISKYETNPKFECSKRQWQLCKPGEVRTPVGAERFGFGAWCFEFVSDFVLRISGFLRGVIVLERRKTTGILY
jgi:hypothetical protein